MRRAPVAIAAIAALAIAASLWAWTRTQRDVVHSGISPAEALAAPDAYREAMRLALANRFADSLPYYRRALGGLAEDSWEVHFNYAMALASNAIQYAPRLGEPRLATRSTAVRVGLVHEAQYQLDRAARIAPDSRTRAQVLGRFANMLSVWGFPWETLDLMRRTQYADTTNRETALRALLYMQMMRDPPLYADDLTVEQALEIGRRAGRPRR